MVAALSSNPRLPTPTDNHSSAPRYHTTSSHPMDTSNPICSSTFATASGPWDEPLSQDDRDWVEYVKRLPVEKFVSGVKKTNSKFAARSKDPGARTKLYQHARIHSYALCERLDEFENGDQDFFDLLCETIVLLDEYVEETWDELTQDNKPSAMEAQPSAPGHEPTTVCPSLAQIKMQATSPESDPDTSGHYGVRNYGPPPSTSSPFANARRMVLPDTTPAESSFEPSPMAMSDEFCKLLRKLEHHKSVVEQLLGEYEPRCAESSAEFASICKQKIDTLEETIMMLPDTASQEIVKKWRKRTVRLWKWYFSVVSAKKRAKKSKASKSSIYDGRYLSSRTSLDSVASENDQLTQSSSTSELSPTVDRNRGGDSSLTRNDGNARKSWCDSSASISSNASSGSSMARANLNRPPDASSSAMVRSNQNRPPDASGSVSIPIAKNRPPEASGSAMARGNQNRPPDASGSVSRPYAQDRPPDAVGSAMALVNQKWPPDAREPSAMVIKPSAPESEPTTEVANADLPKRSGPGRDNPRQLRMVPIPQDRPPDTSGAETKPDAQDRPPDQVRGEGEARGPMPDYARHRVCGGEV